MPNNFQLNIFIRIALFLWVLFPYVWIFFSYAIISAKNLIKTQIPSDVIAAILRN